MGSSFFELNIGLTGLFAAQKGLSVTSNNITNAGTKGYTRQVLNQRAGNAMPGFGKGMIGTGVVTTGIERVRDSYLDKKLWNQNDTLGEYRVKTEQNRLVESVFGEPSDVGFTKIFNDMFKGIDDLSKLPTEAERQQALRQTMITFTKYFNGASSSLKEFQRDANFEVKAKVDEINMLTGRIGSLNKQIHQAEMHGDTANTMRDEREVLVDRLSEIINIEAKEIEVKGPTGDSEKQFVINFNGQNLIDHYHTRFLEVSPRQEKKNPEDADSLYDISWQDGLPFNMGDKNMSGELKGLLDIRDGRGTTMIPAGSIGPGNPAADQLSEINYNGIPYYIDKMNNFVRKFAKAMNDIYNKVPNNPDGTPGTPPNPPYNLFGYDADGDGVPDAGNVDYTRMTAENFTISKDIFDNASNIRGNYEHDPLDRFGPAGAENPNPAKNDLLLDLLGQKDNTDMFKEGDPKDFMIAMFSELGINAKEAKMYEKSQTNITETIKLQRQSVSQVDTNEEFMSLIKYQQAYQVAAKVINTMDGIYETTIFRLGSF